MSGAPLEIHAQLVVRELWNGARLAFPVADPTLVSYGDALTIDEELQLFLGEYLARVEPTVLARFTLPEGARLETVEVLLPFEPLSERLAMSSPIGLACVIAPSSGDWWVFVPKLAHVFHVAKESDLIPSIRAEILRMAGARELDANQYLSLFPPKKERLETLPLLVVRRGMAEDSAVVKEKARLEAERKKRALEILTSVALPLHDRADADRGIDLVGRETELRTLSALLEAKERQSVLLVGPELSGKTALLYAWLRSRSKPKPYVFSTSGAQLIAGMSGLGQWQERLRRVMEAAELLDAVIVFENLSDLFGDRTSGAIDLSGAIRPYLEQHRVRLFGELTDEFLGRFETRDVSFFACLHRLRVAPLDAAAARTALERRIAFDRSADTPQVTTEGAATIIDLAARYLPYLPFPGKAMRFYQEVRALAEKERDSKGAPVAIDSDRVLEAFSVQSGIPVFLLREDRALHSAGVIERFRRRLIGQEEAVRRVVDTICVVKAGLQPSGKPLATFLFIGPTGVGKTELARTLAEFLFGAAERLVRFDMSEYADPYAAERLFRGNDRSDGALTKQIRQQPFSVVLLDEIEKAHAAVFDLLLQILGEGRLTDAKGKTAFFHNAIVIMTSNLGAAHVRSAIGVGAIAASGEAHYLAAVERTFRPELINRLDRIIPFHELDAEQIKRVAAITLERISERRGFGEGKISLQLADEALQLLAQRGTSAAYGARALRRSLEDFLIAPIARLLSPVKPEHRTGMVYVDLPSAPLRPAQRSTVFSELRFAFAQERKKVKREDKTIDQVLAIRGEALACLQREQAVEVQDQIDLIRAQLSQPADEDQRAAADLAQLHIEHHKLDQVWSRTQRLYDDLLAAEDLALAAYLSGQPVEPSADLARDIARELRVALVYVLLCREPYADRISLIAQEHDNDRMLERWLLPLCEQLAARQWTLEISFDRDREPSWPSQRRFGPPRTIAEVMSRLEARDRPPATILIRASGPFAGAMLFLESGLHRWIGLADAPSHLTVTPLALRTQFNDREWLEAVMPPKLDLKIDWSKKPAVRQHDLNVRVLQAAKGKVEEVDVRAPSSYWAAFEQVLFRHLNAEVPPDFIAPLLPPVMPEEPS